MNQPADSRTAHRALRPRRTWPWPDLEVVVTSVCRWIAAGVDVDGPLLLLTWPVIRRWNAGFVVALASRGAPVAAHVVAATRRALRALVRSHAPDADWYRYAGWYAEFDRDEAAGLLSALARKSGYGAGRYRAFVALHRISPERAVPVGEHLVVDHRVRSAVRHWVLVDLAGHDRPAALGVAERAAVRPHDGSIRIEATKFIRLHDPRRAFALFTRITRDPELPRAHRETASLLAYDIDPVKGGESLIGVIESAQGTAERVKGMDNYYHRNPGHLAEYLDEHRWTGTVEERLDFTRYLARRFGRAPDVVIDLASDRTVPGKVRLEALEIDRRAATPDVLEGIIADAGRDLDVAVPAVILLERVASGAAFDHLHGIVTDRGYAFNDRMRAAGEAVGHFDAKQKAALYRGVVTGDDVTAAELKAAVTALKKTDRSEGRVLCAEFARRDTLSTDDRLWFVEQTGSQAASTLLREFARDPDEDPELRVRAARRTASSGRGEDLLYLRALMADHAVPYALRKDVIEDLAEADRIEVLKAITHRLEEDREVRLEAVTALAESDPEHAVGELDRWARDVRLPGSFRSRARDAAQRLRTPR